MPEIFIAILFSIVLIALLSSTVGVYSVFKSGTFMVAGAAHVVLAGAAIGILSESVLPIVNPYLTMVLSAIVLAITVAYLENRHIPTETGVGVIFAAGMSFAVIFLAMLRDSASKAWSYLVGDLYLITTNDILFLLSVALLVLVVALILHRRILFVCFDPEGASAYGLNVFHYNIILYTMIAVSVAVLVNAVGMIIIYTLLIIPPVTALKLENNVQKVMVAAFAISLFSGLLALVFSYVSSLPVSGLAGIILTVIYGITVVKR